MMLDGLQNRIKSYIKKKLWDNKPLFWSLILHIVVIIAMAVWFLWPNQDHDVPMPALVTIQPPSMMAPDRADSEEEAENKPRPEPPITAPTRPKIVRAPEPKPLPEVKEVPKEKIPAPKQVEKPDEAEDAEIVVKKEILEEKKKPSSSKTTTARPRLIRKPLPREESIDTKKPKDKAAPKAPMTTSVRPRIIQKKLSKTPTPAPKPTADDDFLDSIIDDLSNDQPASLPPTMGQQNEMVAIMQNAIKKHISLRAHWKEKPFKLVLGFVLDKSHKVSKISIKSFDGANIPSPMQKQIEHAIIAAVTQADFSKLSVDHFDFWKDNQLYYDSQSGW